MKEEMRGRFKSPGGQEDGGRQQYCMLKSNVSLAKLGMKSSTQLVSQERPAREARDSETSDLHSTSHSVLKRPSARLPHNLSASTRLSRCGSTQERGVERPHGRQNLERMVSQLKEEYAQEARLSRYSNLVKAKSEHNFAQVPNPSQSKRSLAELQEKISEYNKSNAQHKSTSKQVEGKSSSENKQSEQVVKDNEKRGEGQGETKASRLVAVRSESRLLEMRSPERSNKLTEKTQKCRQLCLEIKRKLFKETVSTTTSEVRPALTISDFRLEKLIGEGKFSKVFVARHRRSGVLLAIKIIKKETIKRENFQEQLIRQLKIQSFLSHVNLVKLYAFFHDRLNIYLLLEFCAGGQLYDLFRVKSKLKQEEWQPLMKGICEGLYQLHRHGIIHRDLKPQNIVLSFGIPKIGDFGWSVYSSTDKRETFCGTPLYISPELLLGNSYDRQVDIWALGVMMYEFLTGRIPFKIQHQNNLLEIVNSTISYPKFLSEDCLSLLRLILDKDPASRIGILDILQHPFLNKNLQTSPPYNLFKISR